MRRFGLTVLLALLPASGCAPTRRAASPRLASWPENPCAVLTPAQVSAVTGLEVTEARRAPSITKIVQAQSAGREPGPGTLICVYETRSAFGEIMIIAPPIEKRSTASYWNARETYFRTYPGSAQSIANLGEDAWISGGADLHVLVRPDLHFAVATQMYQERSRDLLIGLARAVLARF